MLQFDWLPAVLSRSGIQYVLTPTWASGKISGWAPGMAGFDQGKYDAAKIYSVQYVLQHSDVSPSNSGEAASLSWDEGDSDFPGVKYNALIGRQLRPGAPCRIFLIGRDRGNHAGTGGPFAHAPQDDLNQYSFGLCYANNNTDEPISTAQLATGRLVTALILEHYGLDAGRTEFHRDWAPGRKTDPKSLDLQTEQVNIAHLMIPAPPHVPSPSEDDMLYRNPADGSIYASIGGKVYHLNPAQFAPFEANVRAGKVVLQDVDPTLAAALKSVAV